MLEALTVNREQSNGRSGGADRLESLSAFCLLANKIILAFYGDRGSCVFSTGVVCDVLAHYGFDTKALRVEAAVFDTKPGGRGVVLGGFSEPMRRKAAGKGAWHGHLVSLVDCAYLIDTSLDQVNDTEPQLRVEPVVIHLRATDWFLCEDPKSYRYHRTGNLSVFRSSDSTVRYAEHPRQNGFKHAGDFQACRRKALVPALITIAREMLTGGRFDTARK